MPLIPPLTLFITWSATMSLMAFAYGGYAGARQAAGRPVVGVEWFRNFLLLFALAINASSLLLVLWTNLPLRFVLDELKPIIGLSLTVIALSLSPLLLWYVFVVPLRVVRAVALHRRDRGDVPHPLDGIWSPAASFLDEIGARRIHPPGGPDAAKQATDPSSPALDRVARLRPVESPPNDRIQ